MPKQTNRHSHWSLFVFEQAETSEKSVSEKNTVMMQSAGRSFPCMHALHSSRFVHRSAVGKQDPIQKHVPIILLLTDYLYG